MLRRCLRSSVKKITSFFKRTPRPVAMINFTPSATTALLAHSVVGDDFVLSTTVPVVADIRIGTPRPFATGVKATVQRIRWIDTPLATPAFICLRLDELTTALVRCLVV